jgi:hypothetical protein
MSTTPKKMRKNAERYRERLEQVRSDWSRSDEAKRIDLEAAYSEARNAHKAFEDEFRAEVKGRLEAARKAAFAPPQVRGADPAMLMASYRSALEQVGRVEDSRGLVALLEQADDTGDALLARSCLRRGYQLQDGVLVGSYLEKDPEHASACEAFCGAAEEYNTLETLGISAAAGVSEPERPQERGRAFAVTRGAPSGGAA